LSHGNGLAIDGYMPFWEPLRDRFEIILFDIRNHGQNPLHGPAGHDLATIVEDFELIWRAIRDNFGAKPAIGVFHSLSAVAAIEHAADRPGRWQALVLFDPPVYPRDGHELQPTQAENTVDMGHRAARRAESFADPARLAGQYIRHPAFRRWVEGAAALMAQATLRPSGDGGWTLACPRELEAFIYATNTDPGLWPRIAGLDIPIKLIAADPTLEDAQMPALIGRAMAAELPVSYEFIPDTTHFLQIEKPDSCIRSMEEFLRQQGLAD
jgi:pimeloyl-ACP methyl ester carboxylesterase